MQGLFNPENGWEVLLLIIVALSPVMVVTLPLVIQRRQGKAIGEIRDHVSNDHTTNLREDIDKIYDLVAEGARENARRFDLLHEAILLETRQRIEGDLKLEVITKEAA